MTTITRFLTLLVFASYIPAYAQSPMDAVPHAFDAAVLTPGAPTATKPLLVDSSPTVHVIVSVLWQTATVTLVSPTGVRHTIGAATSAPAVETFITTHDVGKNHHARLTTPDPGTWQVEIAGANITASIDVGITAIFEKNPVVSVLLNTDADVPANTPARLALATFDGTNRLSGLSITAHAYADNGAAIAITFTDDGTGADAISGDGNYAAVFNAATAGTYEVVVEIRGSASTGSFRRTATASVRAVEQTGVLTGTFTDTPYDGDGDGLWDTIVIAPHVKITQAGTYRATIHLRDSSAKVTLSSFTTSLASENAEIPIVFAAEQLLRDFTENGPYTLAVVDLEHIRSEDEIVLVDRRTDVGTTKAYARDSLKRDRIRFPGTGVTTPHDHDGNGRYDELHIVLDVEIDFAGSYAYSGTLQNSAGDTIGIAAGLKDLSVGSNSLEFTYEGLPIGTHGVDGPYTVSVLIYMQGVSLVYTQRVSLVAPRAYRTPALSASSFELPGPPIISRFTPGSGGPGMQVTITGLRLTGTKTVLFNGVAAAAFQVTGDDTLKATTPSNVSSGPITVTSLAGSTTSYSNFTVVSAPVISGFTPDKGTHGTVVTVEGANFTGATHVRFNGIAASFTIHSANRITATVPLSATNGTLSVTNVYGTGTSLTNFYLPPAIGSFSPNAASQLSTFTISGNNFVGATNVSVNGSEARFEVISQTQITATVPQAATSGVVRVVTPYGVVTSATSLMVLSASMSTLNAQAITPTSIQLTWTGDPSHTYRVVRVNNKNERFDQNFIATVTGNAYTDNNVHAGRTYLYSLQDVNTGLYSNNDYTTTIFFGDALVPGSVVRAKHIVDLQQAVNAMRVAAALPVQTWAEPVTVGARFRAQHVTELRMALLYALVAFGRYAAFTDPSLAPESPMRSIHIQEIRDIVK